MITTLFWRLFMNLTEQEKFQQLEEKSKKIIEGAIQINTKIEAAQDSYQKLCELAKAKFQTDDLEELQTLLESWEKENAEQYENYEKALNQIEAEVLEKSKAIKEIQQSVS